MTRRLSTTERRAISESFAKSMTISTPINSRRFAFETQKTRIYANIKNMFRNVLSLRRFSILRCSRNTIVLLMRLLEILIMYFPGSVLMRKNADYLSVSGALYTHSNSIEKKSRGGFSPDGRFLSAVTFCEALQLRQVRRAPFQGLGQGFLPAFLSASLLLRTGFPRVLR